MEITSRGRLEMSFGAAAVSMRVTEVIVDGKVRVVCASCARAPCLCCFAPQEISRKDVFSSDVTRHDKTAIATSRQDRIPLG